jgi:hypothetical protein
MQSLIANGRAPHEHRVRNAAESSSAMSTTGTRKFPIGESPLRWRPPNGWNRREGVVGGALVEVRFTTQPSDWEERADRVLTLVALSSRAGTRIPARLTRRNYRVAASGPAVVEQHEVPIGKVVQDRDADLEGHHPVIPPVNQEDRRLDAGEVGKAALPLLRLLLSANGLRRRAP